MANQKQKIVWQGKIGSIVEYSPSNQPDKRFQKFSRPPGTRSIIISPDNKILLTKEFRQESGKDDFRLPGGKVYDSFLEWMKASEEGKNMDDAAIEGAKNEMSQEAAIEAFDPQIFKLVGSGGPTVEWDLYYLSVNQYKALGNQALEEGEKITFGWYPISEVIEMCLIGQVDEARTAAVILQFLYAQKKFKYEVLT